MKNINIKNFELDKALIVLTETIEKIKQNLNVQYTDDYDQLFKKMSETRRAVDDIAEEARNIFTESLGKCIDTTELHPTVKWKRDENNNLIKDPFSRKRGPCEICNETRKVEFCHIIPRQLGGSNKETNILYLCSTHHACFDSGILSVEEWEKIDWRAKSPLVKSFGEDVLKSRQREYWDGKKVFVNMAYMGDINLTKWVQSNLGSESVDKWKRKKNNTFFKKTGEGSIG